MGRGDRRGGRSAAARGADAEDIDRIGGGRRGAQDGRGGWERGSGFGRFPESPSLEPDAFWTGFRPLFPQRAIYTVNSARVYHYPTKSRFPPWRILERTRPGPYPPDPIQRRADRPNGPKGKTRRHRNHPRLTRQDAQPFGWPFAPPAPTAPPASCRPPGACATALSPRDTSGGPTRAAWAGRRPIQEPEQSTASTRRARARRAPRSPRLRSNSINLTRTIASTKIGDDATTFVDLEGSAEDPSVERLLASLKDVCLTVEAREPKLVPWFPRKIPLNSSPTRRSTRA